MGRCLEPSPPKAIMPGLRTRAIISALLIGLGGSGVSAQDSAGAATSGPPTVSKIRVTTDSQSLNVEVSTTAPAIPDTDRLENPDRIIFEKLVQVLRFGCLHEPIADCT